MRNCQRGSSLLETIIALALLGIIAVSFLSGLATTSTSRASAAERSSAKILAENIMEQVKKQDYAPSYSSNITIPETFVGYTPVIDVTTDLTERNGSIQKISITISHIGQKVYKLESYKTDR